MRVINEAYVLGVSTRNVEKLVKASTQGMSKSEVSRLCQTLNAQVQAFQTRKLTTACP